MRTRRVVSLVLLMAFLMVLVTSIVLYIEPQGRIARWTGWRLLGLGKGQWHDLHLSMGLLMLASALLHTYLNWRPLVAALRNRARRVYVFAPAFLVALVLTGFFAVTGLLRLPPLGWVLEGGDVLKDRAAAKPGAPPYGHAEDSPLDVLVVRTGLDVARVLEGLRRADVDLENPRERLGDIARRNRLTPQQLYRIVRDASGPPTGARVRRGRGRRWRGAGK